MLGQLIAGFLVIVVGTALLPIVANQVYIDTYWTNATGQFANANVTGAASTILGLVTLFYALAIATSAMGIAASGLRSIGF